MLAPGDDPVLASLLDTVLDQPDDIGIRRIYGDALLERGDPRGELVQLQCDLYEQGDRTLTDEECAQRAEKRRREGLLLIQHRKRWTGTLATRFRRGMVELVYVDETTPSSTVFAALSREPLLDIELAKLDAKPWLGDRAHTLRTLRLRHPTLTPSVVDALLATDCQPTSLQLHAGSITPAAFARLAETWLANATHVRVQDVDVEPAVVDNWLASNVPCEQLAIDGYDTPADLSRFADTLAFPRLRRLELVHQRIGDAALRELVRNPVCRDLESLVLDANQIAGPGLLALADMPRLHTLDVASNWLGTNARAIEMLAAAAPGLRTLDVARNVIGERGALDLALGFPELRDLRIAHTNLSPASLEVICEAHWPLEHLSLEGNPSLGNAAISMLAHSRLARTLRTLDLTGCGLTDEGLAVFGGTAWPRLEHVAIGNNAVSPTPSALANAAAMPSLVEIRGPSGRPIDTKRLRSHHLAYPRTDGARSETTWFEQVLLRLL